MITEKEMEIGRSFGATAFYIYQTVKCNPNSSLTQIEAETGMTDRRIKIYLKTLVDCGMLTRERRRLVHSTGYVYSCNQEQSLWKFH
jgi:predicted transcriptional regulator